VSPDFRDLLFEFNAHGVEYLVVGAYAHGGAWPRRQLNSLRSSTRVSSIQILEPEEREGYDCPRW
jgi:hypothetical protein